AGLPARGWGAAVSTYAMPFQMPGAHLIPGTTGLLRIRRAGGDGEVADAPRATPSAPAAPAPSAPAADVVPAEAAWTPPTWEQVVPEHSARVYRLAYRLTGNRQDAEDLTQEVFVRVFRSLSSYTPGTFEGWLHRITTNLFL